MINKNKKSQEQIIGYILLGIVILSISIAVYNYLLPTLQKSNVRNIAISLEENMKRLAEVISSTGLRYSKSYFELEAPNSQIEILPNLVKLRIKAPIKYYSSYIKAPINYHEPVICYNNSFPVYIGAIYNLCFDESNIKVIINNNNLIINDTLFNKSLILPLTDQKNIITSLFIFDIKNNGTHIIFTSVHPTGIYGRSSACILNAYQVHEDIFYEIVCRPLIDINTKKCYWIRISPYQQSSTFIRDKVTLSINYNYYDDVSYNSTICDSVRLIDLYISIIS